MKSFISSAGMATMAFHLERRRMERVRAEVRSGCKEIKRCERPAAMEGKVSLRCASEDGGGGRR